MTSSFAGDAVHDTDDIIISGCFGHTDVAISKQCDGVFICLYDAVYQIIATGIFNKGYCADIDIFFPTGPQGNLPKPLVEILTDAPATRGCNKMSSPCSLGIAEALTIFKARNSRQTKHKC